MSDDYDIQRDKGLKWDGKQQPQNIGSEQEVILQRGAAQKGVDVFKDANGIIHIRLDVVGNQMHDLDKLFLNMDYTKSYVS